MGQIIGIIAIKGGVGKTTAVCSLAGALVKEFNQKVLVVDGNFSAPNLGLHLGYVEPERTIHDVLREKINIEDAIYTSDHGFQVIAGSISPKPVNPLRLQRKIDQLRTKYDIILIDSSPNPNEEMLAVMQATDYLLCVTTPDYPTLSWTIQAIKHANDRRAVIKGIILNKVRGEKFEICLSEIQQKTNCLVVAVLPDETEVLHALSAATPSTILHGKTESAIEYKHLAAAIIGTTYHDNRIKRKISNLLNYNIKQHESNRNLLRNGIQKDTCFSEIKN